MEDIIYRLATPKDVDRIKHVVTESAQECFREWLPYELLRQLNLSHWMPPLNIKLPGDSVREVSVLEVNRTVAGVCIYGLRTDLELSRRFAEIQALYIKKEFWGRGLGQGLLQHSYMRLNKHQYRSVMVWSFKVNQRAARCFETAGLQPDGAEKLKAYGGREMELIRYTGFMNNSL